MSREMLKALLISGGIIVVLAAIINYLAIPAWNIHSSGLWWFFLALMAILGVVVLIVCFVNEDDGIVLGITWAIIGGYGLLFAIFGIASSAMVNSHKLHDIAQVTVVEGNAMDDFADLSVIESQETLPLVDWNTAKVLGDKKLAGLQHASWYDVSNEYNLIKYQGKYYRLSTIDYADDFFKWNKAQYDGVPGYVLVPVTPENGVVAQEAILVTLENPILYTPNAYWSHDLSRHLRNQYPSYMFDCSFMEIDEKGAPYWVTGVFTPSAGLFGGKVVKSFILTNAQTGASQEYAVDDAPDWIDHIYSLDYLMEIAKWHYGYGNGFLNETFGQANVLRTSYYFRDKHSSAPFANFFGYSSIIDKDGQVCFYTGLTAANAAESNLGWLIVDISTGEMKQYNVVGAEESSAQGAVEQLVQEKGYEATFPLPVNICGEASYLMCLKGKAGLVQSYAICNMANNIIAVQAETLPEAIRLYKAKLTGAEEEPETSSVDKGTETAPPVPTKPPVPGIDGSGTISEVYTAELDGTTQFYYVIDGELYRSAITVNERQILLKKGDTITFKYYSDGNIRVIISIA